MPEIYEIVISLFAAVGIVSLVWLLAGCFFRAGRLNGPARLIVRLDGRTSDVQRALRRFLWLRQWGLADLRVTVVDGGLTPEARAALELLCREEPSVEIAERPIDVLSL